MSEFLDDNILNEETGTPKYNSFMFFGSIRESVEALSEEDGNKLLRAVVIYGTEGIVKSDDPLTRAVLFSIIPNIDNAHVRHQQSLERIERSRQEKEEERRREKENERRRNSSY